MKARLTVYIFLFIAASYLAPLRANAQAAPEKSKIICDHAAPPPGMHYVCKSQCDCHLEGKLKNDQDGIAPAPTPDNQGACQPLIVAAPAYPKTALNNRIGDTVVIQAYIDSDGGVMSVSLEKGHQQLSAPALEAVKKWRFSAGCGNRQTVRMTFEVEYDQKQSSGFRFISPNQVVITGVSPMTSDPVVTSRKMKKAKPSK